MEEENLVPNDSTYFVATEPPEQKVERTKEKANTLEALPVLKELLTHFEQRINFYNSVDSIPKEVKKDPTAFMNMHNANEITKKCLISEKEWVESLLDTHAKDL